MANEIRAQVKVVTKETEYSLSDRYSVSDVYTLDLANVTPEVFSVSSNISELSNQKILSGATNGDLVFLNNVSDYDMTVFIQATDASGFPTGFAIPIMKLSSNCSTLFQCVQTGGADGQEYYVLASGGGGAAQLHVVRFESS